MTSSHPNAKLVPPHFYKYRPMNNDEAIKRVEQIVLHNEVYFAAAASFNDPFDLNPVFSFDAPVEVQRADFIRLSRKFDPNLTDEQHEAEADRVMATSLSPSDIGLTANTFQLAFRRAINTQVGTFCVSEKRDDLLMWAHYADSHRGVCLEFAGDSQLMLQALRVEYSTTRKAINNYTDNQEEMVTKALLTKSDHWAYEAEWRLLRTGEGPGVVRFPPGTLTGIVVGALATSKTIETVRQWASQRSAPLALYRASTSNREFRVLLEPLR